VFTALGFYPVTPGSDEYAIGRPFVSRAAIHLGQGRTFTISAAPLDDAHPYVGAVTLNGKPLDRTYLRHGEIVAGGELHFTMQAEPNREWGGAAAARPAAMSRYGE
jgi:putative alpha-1,2-mannosidase